ncbi:MAG: metalloprotease TldD [Alphaproteobacteria bacterium]|nr:metalloprotease TldD [Alphaproteobacteria bacterium]
MTDLALTDDLFFTRTGLDPLNTRRIVADALQCSDDGELFLEYEASEFLARDDGVLKSASFNVHSGFGLRSVAGELTAYAHAGELNEGALKRAADTVRAVTAGYAGTLALAPTPTNRMLYAPENPLESLPFSKKVELLNAIEAYARELDPLVKQVSVSMGGTWQVVQILRPDGTRYADIRPLVRMDVSVTLDKGGRIETGHEGWGGRAGYELFSDPTRWQHAVKEALRQAHVQLEAIAAPAGEMDVVLGAGWPGVMLHEAVGHGLEGDFHRKGTSVFNGMMGKKVASEHVTVIDDGTIEGRRGSLTVDDEGTPTQRNVLIENGILVGLMQDRLNARLMGVKPTGNGRRESYAYKPMPRMTNTFMMAGPHEPAEIIASVKRGIYAPHFGGGQVDITSGQFVFSAAEAYLIEDGKIGAPVKGATLIGKGADALTRVKMVGNDMKLDNGVGTCGKDGQGVPVGVGQPTLWMNGITVGGTDA